MRIKTRYKTEDILFTLMCIWAFIIIGSMVYQGFEVLISYL